MSASFFQAIELLDQLIDRCKASPHSHSQYKIPTKSADLYTPDLNTLIPSLEKGLQGNFKDVTVNVVKCPDLSEWGNVASKGICGNTRLIDAGGVPFMFDPSLQSTKNYNMYDLVRAADVECGLVIGAGAANSKFMLYPAPKLDFCNPLHSASSEKMEN